VITTQGQSWLDTGATGARALCLQIDLKDDVYLTWVATRRGLLSLHSSSWHLHRLAMPYSSPKTGLPFVQWDNPRSQWLVKTVVRRSGTRVALQTSQPIIYVAGISVSSGANVSWARTVTYENVLRQCNPWFECHPMSTEPRTKSISNGKWTNDLLVSRIYCSTKL